jgi:ribosome-associated translation inhibitor RaiA
MKTTYYVKKTYTVEITHRIRIEDKPNGNPWDQPVRQTPNAEEEPLFEVLKTAGDIEVKLESASVTSQGGANDYDQKHYAAIDEAEAQAERAICKSQGVPMYDNGTPFSF